MKIKIDLSPNFSTKKRLIKGIKFVIIHYTGMQSEIESIKRLKDVNSKVSCHYFINRKGLITQMVKDNRVAWHAGKSKWKTFKNLNQNSLGVELANKGHEFGYQNFSSLQIKSLINLCRNLKKKYKIKNEYFLGHSDIAPIRKSDPGERFPWKKLSKFKLGYWYKINNKKFNLTEQKKIENLFFKNIHKIGYRYFNVHQKTKTDKYVVMSFQRRYLPQNISGKIDLKTYKISHFLAHELKLA